MSGNKEWSCDDILNRLHAGEWVYGINRGISDRLQLVEEMCHRLNSIPPSKKSERDEIIMNMLGEIGYGYVIHSPFHCDFGCNIRIGKNFTSNYNLTILDEAEVVIGDNVFIGPNVSIYTVTHSLDPVQRRDGVMRADGITIGNNVWICGGVTILPGVSIGDGAVIAAGSAVRNNVDAMTLVGGNPAKPIRKITEKDVIPDVFG